MRTTQNQKILNHLRMYGTLTSLEAFQMYQITRLSGRIHELRKQGYNIIKERRKAINGAVYAAYKLEGEQ